MKPPARTMKWCRNRGWPIVGSVERWIPYPKREDGGGPPGIRKDLFGFIDVECLDDEDGVLGIQCCAASGAAAHRTKALALDELYEWLKRGNRFEIHGWRKADPKADRSAWVVNRWEAVIGGAVIGGNDRTVYFQRIE